MVANGRSPISTSIRLAPQCSVSARSRAMRDGLAWCGHQSMQQRLTWHPRRITAHSSSSSHSSWSLWSAFCRSICLLVSSLRRLTYRSKDWRTMIYFYRSKEFSCAHSFLHSQSSPRSLLKEVVVKELSQTSAEMSYSTQSLSGSSSFASCWTQQSSQQVITTWALSSTRCSKVSTSCSC